MRQLPSLGKLKQDPHLPDEWVSKPVAVPFCHGKTIRFAVRTPPDGTNYPPDVDQAVRNFLALADADRAAAAEAVYKHYRFIAEEVQEVEVEIATPAEIWDHATPTDISVDRYEEADGQVYVRVVYSCDWEPEHGLQILLRHGTTITLVGEHEDGSFVENE